MANGIGRNDSCPCGSGIKYKKCCMNKHSSSANVLDYFWHALRQTEGVVIDNHLFPYATQELPEVFVSTALEDFFSEELPDGVEEEILFDNFFVPWLLFSWIPFDDFGVKGFNPTETLAQNYLTVHRNKLSGVEMRFIEEMNNTYYSFYSVLDVEFEKSLIVKDIMLGITHIIKERQGTHKLKRGDVIFSRIVTLDNQSIFVGMAPYIIPTNYHINLIDLRKWLIAENNSNELSPVVLRNEFAVELHEYFFKILVVAYSVQLPAALHNTDGDPVEFSKTHFKLTISPEKALSQLLPLTLSKDPDDFLDNAERDKFGKIRRLEFPWLKKGNKKHKSWDNTVMGHVILVEGRLILETNSIKRAEKGKKLLNKYLGNAINFQQTLIESPEKKLKSLPEKQGKKSAVSDPLKISEIREQMEEMAKAHWKNWFDEPIPALDNKTPREAAKTEIGREKLEALLLQYERYDQEKDNNVFKADISYLRAELALD